MNLQELLKHMIDRNASDIFIIAGLPFTYRVSGRQIRDGENHMMPSDTKDLVEQLYAITNRSIDRFMDSGNHDDDFSFSIAGIGRFRANIFRQRGSLGAVVRVIPFGLPDPAKFHIPEEVLRLADLPKGLVLVTGPAGAGKTTTLACIVDRINHQRTGHIITMEDPIEYVHHHGTCIVTQREVPTDVASYSEALRSAMREAPDILLIGEMRDNETITIAMTAAEQAQLIFSTLHTTSASGTIDRIVDAFPATQQLQVRIQLSMVIQAIVCQQLVPSKNGSTIPAFEIMIANTAIRNLIRERKAYQIDSVIASSLGSGMYTMDQSLFELVKRGRVTKDTALRYSIHHEALAARFAVEHIS